jgi:hypothetical protein
MSGGSRPRSRGQEEESLFLASYQQACGMGLHISVQAHSYLTAWTLKDTPKFDGMELGRMYSTKLLCSWMAGNEKGYALKDV